MIKQLSNPFKLFGKKEWILWVGSLAVILCSSLVSREFDIITLTATLFGMAGLIFASVGSAWSQIVLIVFILLYALISWKFRYWGEMITYLGMTFPMNMWALIAWIRNPSEKAGEVKIRPIGKRELIPAFLLDIVVTVAFFFILRYFDTPNLEVSTISVATSFMAAELTMLRSTWFSLAYAANDMVLIVLWIMASVEDPWYIPIVVNFTVFLINDINTFINWRRRERLQVISNGKKDIKE